MYSHILRFLTHLLAVLNVLKLPYKQELMDACIEHYLAVRHDILIQFLKIGSLIFRASDFCLIYVSAAN